MIYEGALLECLASYAEPSGDLYSPIQNTLVGCVQSLNFNFDNA